MSRLSVPFLVSVLLMLPLSAQAPSASVLGRIVDATGAVVPGVAVKLINLDTNQAFGGSTGNSGEYTVPLLQPGRYALEAQAKGFRTYRQEEFALAVDQSLRVDIHLEVGVVNDVITVAASLPALTTETGERGDVTTNAELTEMPLNGRNFSDLVYLTGGVLPKGEDGDGAYAINGARADNVGFLIDGMNNTQRRNTTSMVSPALEGVQEFKIVTSGFSAEYGRFAGGVLSVVTKSGGNRLRGAAYEFLRNDVVDARNFFDVQKSKLRQNQFGAMVSGPVVLPRLYHGRDRTFFLFTWESLRMISGSTVRGITPLPAMLTGDFSGARDAFGNPMKITDSLAKNAPFAGNQIPASRLDPMSKKLAAFYPAANLAGSANNYLAQGNSTNSFNNFSAKVDEALTGKDRLTFSTFWRPSTSFNPFQRTPVADFGATNQQFGLLSGVRYVRTLTPMLFNEANANFSRQTLYQGWPGNTRDWSSDVGFTGGNKYAVDLGLPVADVSGYILLGHSYDLPKIWAYNNWQAADSLTWLKGRHMLKMGGDILHYQYFNKYYNDLRGRMTFLGRFSGEPMADFMLGYVQSSRRLMDVSREYMLASSYSAFVQDDYKITPSLTLNIGVRYELPKQPKEKFNSRAAFVPELGKVVMAGDGGLANIDALIAQTGLPQYFTMASAVGLPETIVRTNYSNVAPRFGFAWRPFNNSRNVVRGGYGIFYGTDSLYRYDELSNVYPFTILQTFSASSSNPTLLTVSSPFPLSRQKISGINTTSGQLVNQFKSQYLQSWNLTLEREILSGTVVEISYAGSKGTHLPRRYDANQQFVGPGMRQPNGTYPRPFPDFTTINVFGNMSNSIYNAGTVTLRRRLSHGLFFRTTYVYSKSIDESSNTGGTIAGGFPSAQDSRNLHGERGRSDFDMGHSFMASFIYQPKLTHYYLLKDWQIAGTTTAYTGAPFTPKVANYDITTGGAARPDRIAKGTLSNPSPDAWFDRTVLPVVPVGSYRFGSSGRNILDGPGAFNFNASLSRRFVLRERTALQFRGEAFNLTNRANFNLPSTEVDVQNGAVISQAKAPRVYQFGLRLEF